MKLLLEWRPEYICRAVDPNVGAEMFQLTSAALVSHNIYCESRYCSADGTIIPFLRSVEGYLCADLWLCDMTNKQVAPVCAHVLGHPAAVHYGNILIFIRETEKKQRILMRLDLKTHELNEIMDMKDCPKTHHPVGCISPDERYYLSNVRIKDEMYGLYRIELSTGRWEIFHEHEDICNPHPQYEPSLGRDIMVQHNRGCKLDENNNIIRLGGEEGATLYLVDSDGGDLRPLPVGKPHTGAITGHECWIGKTGRIILTLDPRQFGKTETHIVTPGEGTSRCFIKGLLLGHVSASDDGRFFISDDFTNGRIYAAGIKTGRLLPLCETGMSGITAGCQSNHPHPYMTPDNGYVIFNSNRTGVPQIWAAKIPDGFLEALEV